MNEWISDIWDVYSFPLIVIIVCIISLVIIIPMYTHDTELANEKCESAYNHIMNLDIVTAKDEIWYLHECPHGGSHE